VLQLADVDLDADYGPSGEYGAVHAAPSDRESDREEDLMQDLVQDLVQERRTERE
jgi:hypothetical protein